MNGVVHFMIFIKQLGEVIAVGLKKVNGFFGFGQFVNQIVFFQGHSRSLRDCGG
jgi:hypothetical protein